MNVKGLIIAPGLETYLAAITIDKEKPSYIAFITDEATNEMVGKILEKMKMKPLEYKKFFVKQYVSTMETMQEFFKAYYWLKEKGVSEVIVDASNTLKPRAIALYMTSSFIDVFKDLTGEEPIIKLDYINCPFDSNGKPIIGKEELIELDEPSDTIGFALSIYAINLFNNFVYSSAAKIFEMLEKRTTSDHHLLYSGLKKLSNSFDMWEKFQLSRAIKEMDEAILIFRKVKTYIFANKILPQLEGIRSTLADTEKDFGLHQIVDLYQNANRRLEENRFDDALARFYSCLELISRFSLGKHGIDPSNPDYAKLPEACMGEFKKRNKGLLPIEIELKKGFELLACLNDPLGREVEKDKKTFLGLIGLRNQSILAHGIKPVSEQNALMFKEKLAGKLLLGLLEQEKVESDKMLNLHLHIKLPITLKEFYKKII